MALTEVHKIGAGDSAGGDEAIIIDVGSGTYLCFFSWGLDYGSGISDAIQINSDEFNEIKDMNTAWDAEKYLESIGKPVWK